VEFLQFLNELRTIDNNSLLEAVISGYNILFEETIDVSKHETIIKQGTTLYHGTMESFDVRKITTGGYDEVLWTTTNLKIAKYYIPVVGGYTMNVDLERNITVPFLRKEEPWYSIVSKQLGISERIKDILINKAEKIKEEGYQWYLKEKEYKELSSKLETEIDAAYKNKDAEKQKELSKLQDENFKRWNEAEDKYKSSPNIDYTYFLKKLIADKMEKLFGYKLEKSYGDEKYKKIIQKNDELMPENYQDVGKVVVLKPKRDLKLYNYAYGRSEGDLMDVDYHKIDLFREVEAKGYDGVVIHDFAQSAKWGNYGHLSFGLFKNTIKDCNISSMQKQVHPIDEASYKL
jgi:hypothetical protein